MGRLTTHVLDTAKGRPAAGLKIDLFANDKFLKNVVTNKDGRTGEPLLEGNDFATGIYELRFHAGAYLKAQDVVHSEPMFLDLIPIRFGIADPSQHYHVPLLLSPFGYSTYRGS